jgi:hypothetical protein
VKRKLLVLILSVIAFGTARADDRYYLLVFGAERPSRSFDHAHSFASFVKRSETPDGAKLEVRTISWLPAKLPVRTLKIRPETGHNYELHETIRILQADRQRVSVWGPYEIRPELFDMASRRIRDLESGRLLYKSYDGFFHSARVVNCIHALTTLVERDRVHVLTPGWGDVSSNHIAELLMPWVLDRCTTHDHVARELSLDEYCLAYRKVSGKPAIATRSGLPLLLRDPNPPLTAGPPAVRGRR